MHDRPVKAYGRLLALRGTDRTGTVPRLPHFVFKKFPGRGRGLKNPFDDNDLADCMTGLLHRRQKKIGAMKKFIDNNVMMRYILYDIFIQELEKAKPSVRVGRKATGLV
jgi:hypothetical protein